MKRINPIFSTYELFRTDNPVDHDIASATNSEIAINDIAEIENMFEQNRTLVPPDNSDTTTRTFFSPSDNQPPKSFLDNLPSNDIPENTSSTNGDSSNNADLQNTTNNQTNTKQTPINSPSESDKLVTNISNQPQTQNTTNNQTNNEANKNSPSLSNNLTPYLSNISEPKETNNTNQIEQTNTKSPFLTDDLILNLLNTSNPQNTTDSMNQIKQTNENTPSTSDKLASNSPQPGTPASNHPQSTTKVADSPSHTPGIVSSPEGELAPQITSVPGPKVTPTTTPRTSERLNGKRVRVSFKVDANADSNLMKRVDDISAVDGNKGLQDRQRASFRSVRPVHRSSPDRAADAKGSVEQRSYDEGRAYHCRLVNRSNSNQHLEDARVVTDQAQVDTEFNNSLKQTSWAELGCVPPQNPVTTETAGEPSGSVMGDGEERPILFHSRQLKPAEHNYHITELELAGLTWAVLSSQTYFEGQHLTVVTNHTPLRAIVHSSTKQLFNSRVNRFRILLQPFLNNMTVIYRPGKDLRMVDPLSRLPAPNYQDDDLKK